MKVLVFEYITGAGQAGAPSHTLAAEGDLMLDALLADLSALPGLRLLALRDRRLPITPAASARGVDWRFVEPGADGRQCWRELLAQVDAAWPIAPESDGLLEALCRDVEQAGKVLLTTGTAGVELAASKRRTLARLAQHGIPVVPSRALPADADAPPWPFPFVVKPDGGAGCEETYRVSEPGQWARRRNAVTADTPRLAQPWLAGESLSLSLLAARGQAALLSINTQLIHVDAQGGISLRGCRVGSLADSGGTFQRLATAIAAAMPELWGLSGVDLILTTQGPQVLEVNPRLTSSHAGLGSATGVNPAALVLQLQADGVLPAVPPPRAQPVTIAWGGH